MCCETYPLLYVLFCNIDFSFLKLMGYNWLIYVIKYSGDLYNRFQNPILSNSFLHATLFQDSYKDK
jgi:hypothetical protein